MALGALVSDELPPTIRPPQCRTASDAQRGRWPSPSALVSRVFRSRDSLCELDKSVGGSPLHWLCRSRNRRRSGHSAPGSRAGLWRGARRNWDKQRATRLGRAILGSSRPRSSPGRVPVARFAAGSNLSSNLRQILLRLQSPNSMTRLRCHAAAPMTSASNGPCSSQILH
jgi:hypothetical protein